MSGHPPVRRIPTWIPISDESIVDLGIGSVADQAAAAARIEVRRRAVEARWRALPWRVRAGRIARWHWAEARSRLEHAGRALRGIDCEADE